ncbi:hypothetical protein [Roseibium algae]|uniref:DUF3888 domain-containing protein n=1 Tax=Roseibium algae TaxID=3123038 RepID=A0ABU8TRQ8_9HYPH
MVNRFIIIIMALILISPMRSWAQEVGRQHVDHCANMEIANLKELITKSVLQKQLKGDKFFPRGYDLIFSKVAPQFNKHADIWLVTIYLAKDKIAYFKRFALFNCNWTIEYSLDPSFEPTSVNAASQL